MSFEFLIFLFSWFTFSSTARARWTKPDCPSSCGNINIPYPFGVGKGCYQNEEQELHCNTSFTPPRLLYGKNFPVRNISLNGTMTIAVWVAFDCYNENGNSTYKFAQSMKLSKHFTLSNTQNKFTAIGCDTIAFMSDTNNETVYFQSGCFSFCAALEDVPEQSCSGIGCCQTEIPKGLKSLDIQLLSGSKLTTSRGFNPCSFGFLADTDVFKFSPSDLKKLPGTKSGFGQDDSNASINETLFPAVLDWVIGMETCENAKKNIKSYACVDNNSDCVDSNNGDGYRCYCKTGFKGNPYFVDGCKDNDECLAPNNPCGNNSICTNTLGSYDCSCLKGYIDQGAKDGNDCIAKREKLPTLKLGLGIGLGLLLLLGLGFSTFWGIRERRCIRRREKFFKQNGGSLLKQQLITYGGNVESTCIFSAKELEQATNNYDKVLGQGGFGTVYKGTLSDGRVVAIKKSKILDKNQNEQFINEFLILSQVTHPNVVKLYGCCLETEVPILVYEYVSNGNLFQHIHENKNGNSITWEIRLKIASETARALAYLHSTPSIPIIHRDIKSANILLDHGLAAKVADFGISKLVQLDQAQMSTLVQGTLGYLDPEYFQTGQLTKKSDVFSFGVLLVELLTGKIPVCSKRSHEEKSLAIYFTTCLKQNRFWQLVEPNIINEGMSKQILAYSELAKRCLSWTGEERPTMEEVAMELEELRKYEMHPWNPPRNEESWNLISGAQDLYSVELTSYTGDSSGQYSMDIMRPR